jgi:hypothetical protein
MEPVLVSRFAPPPAGFYPSDATVAVLGLASRDSALRP